MIQKITNPDNLSSVFCTPIGMDSKNVTVLIVDDEPDICFLLGNMLKQKSFKPIMANSLSEGLEKLKKHLPALLFLDIHLPDGSGLDILSRIKKDFPNLKIIMMSAYDGPREKTRAIEEGADIFISKPLSRDLITESLSKVLNK
jgi:two-component system KDP operon response regulator KdpE